MGEAQADSKASPPRVFAGLLVLIGATLFAGGAYLIVLEGSFYYVLCGAAVIVSGVLLWKGDRRGAQLYGVMLVLTLLWSLWEVGLDGWGLMPRVLAPAVLGLWLLTPWVRHGLA